jgi:aspartyl-tRNA(Asn)/glutamyl-tRNA(Gln) amidotransferase subunit C
MVRKRTRTKIDETDYVTFANYHEAMPTFTKEQIDHLGDLARIALSDDETERLQKDLNVIAESIQKVQEVAGEDVPPTANPVPLEAHLREDVAATPLTQKEALAGGPRTEAGMFVAPQILGGE